MIGLLHVRTTCDHSTQIKWREIAPNKSHMCSLLRNSLNFQVCVMSHKSNSLEKTARAKHSRLLGPYFEGCLSLKHVETESGRSTKYLMHLKNQAIFWPFGQKNANSDTTRWWQLRILQQSDGRRVCKQNVQQNTVRMFAKFFFATVCGLRILSFEITHAWLKEHQFEHLTSPSFSIFHSFILPKSFRSCRVCKTPWPVLDAVVLMRSPFPEWSFSLLPPDGPTSRATLQQRRCSSSLVAPPRSPTWHLISLRVTCVEGMRNWWRKWQNLNMTMCLSSIYPRLELQRSFKLRWRIQGKWWRC